MSELGYVCQYHQCAVPGHDACAFCMEERATLPAVETMTAAERATEFEMWIGRDQLTVDWSVFVDRLEALLGRGIFTHELSTSNCPSLVAEAWGNIPAPQYVDEIVAKLPPHLQDSVVTFDLNDNDRRDFSDN